MATATAPAPTTGPQVKAGDMVTWQGSNGPTTGKVLRVVTAGTLKSGANTIPATAADPALLIKIYRGNTPTPLTVVKKWSEVKGAGSGAATNASAPVALAPEDDAETASPFGGYAPTVTLHDIEFCRVGDWPSSTGRADITEERLTSIVEAAADAMVDKAPIHPGHYDPRFMLADGEPALGWARPTRVERRTITVNGQEKEIVSLVGDFVDVPVKFADAIRSAYPRRSVELLTDFAAPSGVEYPAVLRGMALLGVAAPAVKGLDDVVARYSEGPGQTYKVPASVQANVRKGMSIKDADKQVPSIARRLLSGEISRSDAEALHAYFENRNKPLPSTGKPREVMHVDGQTYTKSGKNRLLRGWPDAESWVAGIVKTAAASGIDAEVIRIDVGEQPALTDDEIEAAEESEELAEAEGTPRHAGTEPASNNSASPSGDVTSQSVTNQPSTGGAVAGSRFTDEQLRERLNLAADVDVSALRREFETLVGQGDDNEGERTPVTAPTPAQDPANAPTTVPAPGPSGPTQPVTAQPTQTQTRELVNASEGGGTQVVNLSAGRLQELEQQARDGAEALKFLAAQRRDGIISDAVRHGQIALSEKQTWREEIDKDEDRIVRLLGTLPKNESMPTEAVGHAQNLSAAPEASPQEQAAWDNFSRSLGVPIPASQES